MSSGRNRSARAVAERRQTAEIPGILVHVAIAARSQLSRNTNHAEQNTEALIMRLIDPALDGEALVGGCPAAPDVLLARPRPDREREAASLLLPDLVQHGRHHAAVHDARIALVMGRYGVVTHDLQLAVVEKLHVQADGIAAAADETHFGIGLFVRG